MAVAYQDAGRLYGIELDESTIRARFREALGRYSVSSFQQMRGAVDPLRTDEPCESLRWQAIVEHVLQPSPTQKQAVFRKLWDHFSRPENWRLFDDVIPTLEQLGGSGYRLGLASNFDQRLRPIIQKYLGDFPLELFISSEIGWVKPAEAFYAEVTRRLEVPIDQIFLIGDDWENDVSAPQTFGWQTAYLCRDGKPRGDTNSPVFPELLDVVRTLLPDRNTG
ncbi:hypothetical protein DTL42_16680 [Bremerella cremea]|uniref:HAD family hydrolase n=1 Tax=Bremerella cremea TaxID=1031537 RepID=A0A368KNT3_9BACT|nr:hypothetical protein DTL42_16680 [Bremerella cremea]